MSQALPPAAPFTAIARAADDDLGRADHRRVVPWLSAHVAAVEHVVLPAARRTLPAPLVSRQIDRTRRLEHALLQLHQAQGGDGRGAALGISDVAGQVRTALEAHLGVLEELLVALRGTTDEGGWSRLVESYADAARNAPSRPHPHTPHGTLGERISFPIARAVDHLLDALDSRVVPALPEQRNDEPASLSEVRRTA